MFSQEHHIVDRDIRDLSIRCDLAGVGQNIRLLHVIVLVLHKGAQCAVDGVILTGLDLDGGGGQSAVIVDQIIDLETQVYAQRFSPTKVGNNESSSILTFRPKFIRIGRKNN